MITAQETTSYIVEIHDSHNKRWTQFGGDFDAEHQAVQKMAEHASGMHGSWPPVDEYRITFKVVNEQYAVFTPDEAKAKLKAGTSEGVRFLP